MAGDTGLRIVRVTSQKDLVQLYRFRYRVFVEELGWMARKDRALTSSSTSSTRTPRSTRPTSARPV